MIDKPLTWDELANIYHEKTGQQARIKPMDAIFEWAENHPEWFYLDEKEGTLYNKEKAGK